MRMNFKEHTKFFGFVTQFVIRLPKNVSLVLKIKRKKSKYLI